MFSNYILYMRIKITLQILRKKEKNFNVQCVAMVEVEEIELDLGLSIGGSFKNSTTKPDLKPDEFHSDPDLNNGMQQVDPQAKREFQALRRLEAKKKREMKRGTSGDRVGESESECKWVFKRGKTEFFDGVSGGTAMASWTTPFHAQQPYPYATVQYVPLNNGLELPCWVTREKNVGGIDGVNGGDGKVKSNGSSRCSSSVVSDYQSSSREDGGSTDSHSHSAHSFVEATQMNSSKEINIRSQPAENASSHPMRSKLDNNVHLRNHNVKETESQSNVTQPNPIMLKEEPTTESKALSMPIEKPLANENPSNSPLKETKVDMGQPPKPLSQASSFPQMPYVSTKGNGPNGRTVHGFLYRYTKSEVCIVCVCHGSTFSPAEFVQHAGGTDISHPLRHITVIPSAFG